MKESIKKWPALEKHKVEKYEDLFLNLNAEAEWPAHVKEYRERLKTRSVPNMMSYRNKDYLGAFMAPFSRDLNEADVAIIGVPFEQVAPVTSSHKEGPTVLRKYSKRSMSSISETLDVPFDMCRIIDYGNIDVFGLYDIAKEMELYENHFRKIVLENDITPFVWGGDHSVTDVPLRVLGEKYGPIGVIHFDAHYDLYGKGMSNKEFSSGHWFAKAISMGLVDPERSVQIGMRGTQSVDFHGISEKYGIKAYTSDDVFDLGVKTILKEAIEVIGEGPTYLTFDLDVLDPTYHVSNSSPEPFGLTTRQIYDLISGFRGAQINLIGGDVAEYTPLYDPAGKDANVTCGISWQILLWLVEQRAKRQGEWRQTEWDLVMGLQP